VITQTEHEIKILPNETPPNITAMIRANFSHLMILFQLLLMSDFKWSFCKVSFLPFFTPLLFMWKWSISWKRGCYYYFIDLMKSLEIKTLWNDSNNLTHILVSWQFNPKIIFFCEVVEIWERVLLGFYMPIIHQKCRIISYYNSSKFPIVLAR